MFSQAKNESSSSTDSLIETEFLRAELWRQIVNNQPRFSFRKNPGRFKLKENLSLLLRYVFNKIISLKDQSPSDPVFMIHHSPLAESQLEYDFKYFRILSPTPKEMIQYLEEFFRKASDQIQKSTIQKDEIVTGKEDQSLEYKEKRYSVGPELWNKPHCWHAAIALRIRYDYLNLGTQGLAVPYKNLGFKSDDNILEAFASSFNHYFDKYHSAFPDLEKTMGSLGSFWARNRFEESIIMVNPPFDATLLRETIKKAVKCLEDAKNENRKQTWYLTLPAWRDEKTFTTLAHHPFCSSFVDIIHSKTLFIDHFSGKMIQPCDIFQITLTV
jgi:Phosphorylated CTD interacting factor 1 WW domain